MRKRKSSGFPVPGSGGGSGIMGMIGVNGMANRTVMAIVSYSLCSCSMLLINKLAMYYLHFPSMVSVFQFLFCVCVVLGLRELGIDRVDSLEWRKVKHYLIYCFGFAGGCYANMRTLEASNVETVIVFRASTPLAVGMLDYLFMNREFPSLRSLMSLVAIVAGAAVYVLNDAQFEMNGIKAYMWAAIYFVFLCFNMVYGKSLIRDISMESKISGSVYYTNLLSVPFMMGFAFLKDEPHRLIATDWAEVKGVAYAFLILSAVAGTGISYAGWWCRDCISATSFTLVGVLNKMATIAVNCMIWDQHASTTGIIALMGCLIGGSLYQQSPVRKQKGDQHSPNTTEEMTILNQQTPKTGAGADKV